MQAALAWFKRDPDAPASLSTLTLKQVCSEYLTYRFDHTEHEGYTNLPYYAATHIIKRLIDYRDRIADMTVMMQKEVVDRLIAHPGQKEYGSLTVYIQFHCQVERLLEIDKTEFSPPPKIDSSLVKLTPLAKPRVQVKNQKTFFKVVNAAFMHGGDRRGGTGRQWHAGGRGIYGFPGRHGTAGDAFSGDKSIGSCRCDRNRHCYYPPLCADPELARAVRGSLRLPGNLWPGPYENHYFNRAIGNHE